MPEPVHLDSRVDSVAVYRAGALVTRVAELTESTDRVHIGPLPLGLHDGSVRVAIRGEGATPVATDVRVTLEVPARDASLPPARPEDLDAAEQRVARLRDEADRIRGEADAIERIGVVVRPADKPGREPPPSPAAARVALLAMRDGRLEALDEARDRIERELREAERALADLRERERRASSARQAEPHELRKAALIGLRGGGGPATIELTYRVDAARWAPSYALRLDSAMGSGALEVRAVVAQRTGEDWEGVALTLSTAELRGWAELPELSSLRIGRRVPPRSQVGWRPPPTGAEALFEDFDRARPSPSSSTLTGSADLPPGGIPAMIEQVLAEETAREAGPRVTRSGVGPPMPQAMAPPPSAMPAPPAPELMRARAKSASILGAVAGAAADAFGGGPGDAGALRTEETLAVDAPAEAPVELTAREEMLDYGRLRMPPPRDRARGRLVLKSRRELYVAWIEEAHLEVDVSRAMSALGARTRQVLDGSLPQGFVALSPTGFDYAYRAEGRVNAPSDGVFHNLALSAHHGDARSRFVVVPRESRDAFRFVEMENPLGAPLLDGPIDVYVGEDFLMTSRVREVPPGGALRLGLGVEQRLKVARNARFSEKSAGLMGGRLDLEHAIDIELSNQLPRAADVEVRERLPVTREGEDDITVVEGEVTPRWQAWEPDDDPTLEGGRRWRLTVPAGESAALTARYTIRIAAKHELVGGNRREG